jgi:hypothetical protein
MVLKIIKLPVITNRFSVFIIDPRPCYRPLNPYTYTPYPTSQFNIKAKSVLNGSPRRLNIL